MLKVPMLKGNLCERYMHQNEIKKNVIRKEIIHWNWLMTDFQKLVLAELHMILINRIT
jgi:hypothetical protein